MDKQTELAIELGQVIYTNTIKSLEEKVAALEAQLADIIPLNAETVQCYLIALGKEASDRGGMFPQTSDEQDNDSRCLNRVYDMIKWYNTRGGGYPTYNQVSHWRALRARHSGQTVEPELRKVEPKKHPW